MQMMSGQESVRGPYRQYAADNMKKAVEACFNGMPIREAVRTFGVKRSTLQDKVHNRVPVTATSGPDPILTCAEEDLLVDYIIACANIGYPLDKNDLKDTVKIILDKDGRPNMFKNNRPGDAWFDLFRKRNEKLVWRTPQDLGYDRARLRKDDITEWFAGLQMYLINEVPQYEEILQDPDRLLNADESGFPLKEKKRKVLAQIGNKHVFQCNTPGHEQISVLACVTAGGKYPIPMIIFKGCRLRNHGQANFPDAIYSTSENGWMEKDIFFSYLQYLDTWLEEKSISKPVI
jgi:hypothetical protein